MEMFCHIDCVKSTKSSKVTSAKAASSAVFVNLDGSTVFEKFVLVCWYWSDFQ